MKFLFVIILSVFFSGIAMAFPTGTIWVPSDLVAESGRWRLDSRVFFTLDKRASDTGSQSPFFDGGVGYGIFDNHIVGMEAGLDWWEPESQDNLKSLHMHAKFSVHESSSFPSVALGFYNFGFKSNTTDENILYFGLGKTFDFAGHFFLGYSSGNQNVLVDDQGRAANGALIFSWQRPFPSLSPKLSILADLQSSTSPEGAISFGFKWNLDMNMALILGYDIYNNRNFKRDTFTFQFFAGL